jgi:transposase-like protein
VAEQLTEATHEALKAYLVADKKRRDILSSLWQLQMRAVLALRDEGLSRRQIAGYMGLSHQRVQQLLGRNGK